MIYDYILMDSDDGVQHSELLSFWTLDLQWLRLALSKGPNWLGVFLPLTWGRKQIQFPKRCVL
jgi:hypothetical protein